VSSTTQELLGRGYNGASGDLAAFNVRVSQGGGLDSMFPCVGP